ncbi:MAG TPA: bifunctional demethylmenaquinone methyltransferase/2-methoxy-6-polyprenyl-1,4-benzoquinol methylase UbiE [Bacteroidetes bacterium]|nr:bifunctional demethylmenaquinone methyltransferase/2-methoxy-6-polyprenyl-1,4-benzoquinol methylase UbiE [Bacteroidota bacterium]
MVENKAEKVKPYNPEENKKKQVENMFDNISGKYDFLNHLLSMGIDKSWRKNLIKILSQSNPENILDVATGTGDLAIQIAKSIKNCSITGLDISQGMLDVGIQKIEKQNLENRVQMLHGDSEKMPFVDESFDAVTAAFGVRNFETLIKGLKEMHRVLKPGGKVFILEFSKPRTALFRFVFNTYFKYILPGIGKFTSKDPKAYKYLFESVQAFPSYDDFLKIMQEAGFKSNNFKIQSLGICSIYYGEK